ncbi:hypothetical protein [Flavitalea sp.]|nr:hypothetical protein [Flavitalea sp.]
MGETATGIRSGENNSSGTYTWITVFTDATGRKEIKKGIVLLIR